MTGLDDSVLYLNRRSDIRVNFRKTVRFNIEPKRPLRGLRSALSQNVSLRGMEILTPAVLAQRTPFDVWIPLDDQEVLRATAITRWQKLENTLGDSPYWIRAGVSLHFKKPEDRKLFSDLISRKAKFELATKQEAESKIGFVF